MKLAEVYKKYNTQAKCLKKLEVLRWGKAVKCPYCESKSTRPTKSEAGRHSCKTCKRSFTVMVGTIFEHSTLPLPKWFELATLMLNAKGGMNAMELKRNVKVTYKTAYYVAMRIRIGMLEPDTKLNGIIEMDESYFGGKARKLRAVTDNTPSLAKVDLKRGRGTHKISVVGMVQRKGKVRTKVVEKLTKRNLLSMLKRYAKKDNSLLMTDGFRSYKTLEQYIDRLVINHSKAYSKGITHINTIEGYWSFVKNGIRGNFKSISKKYLPFYLIEYEWKYNHRNFKGNQLENFLKNALKHEKELEYWKAQSTQHVKEVAYD